MVTAPTWLTQRGAVVKLGSDGKTWYVLFNHEPTYSVTAVPVVGKFGCLIRQTINGKRIESAGTFDGPDEAVQAGLEDVRKALGWG